MTVYPYYIYIFKLLCPAVFIERFFHIDAEFILFKSCRNMGVCHWIDIRIYPQRYPGFCSHLLRTGIDNFQLLGRFNIKHQYSIFNGKFYLILSLADTGINYFSRIHSRQKRPIKFTTRHNVHSPAFFYKHS